MRHGWGGGLTLKVAGTALGGTFDVVLEANAMLGVAALEEVSRARNAKVSHKETNLSGP